MSSGLESAKEKNKQRFYFFGLDEFVIVSISFYLFQIW